MSIIQNATDYIKNLGSLSEDQHSVALENSTVSHVLRILTGVIADHRPSQEHGVWPLWTHMAVYTHSSPTSTAPAARSAPCPLFPPLLLQLTAIRSVGL